MVVSLFLPLLGVVSLGLGEGDILFCTAVESGTNSLN
jgi:hypothetical protein